MHHDWYWCYNVHVGIGAKNVHVGIGAIMFMLVLVL